MKTLFTARAACSNSGRSGKPVAKRDEDACLVAQDDLFYMQAGHWPMLFVLLHSKLLLF